MSKKVSMVSLGCPKNLVDGEIMLASLKRSGYEILNEVDGADIVIVNTCGFIEDAKKEAIENILDMIELKKDGIVKNVLVTGCLAERYKDELLTEIPEIDGVMGIGANGNIVKACDGILENEQYRAFPPKEELPLNGERYVSTPDYYAYLKIADGCSNHCAYCAIPSIRGEFRSRKAEDIIDEAKTLASSGVKELIIIAQDTTRYGEDLYGKSALPALLTALSKIDGIRWLRMLYCYPDRITEELLDVMANNDKVVKYIDLPLQHADKNILKSMNRKGDKESLLSLVKYIRKKVPGVVLRTTLITGFPGETEQAFETLSEFVNEAKFDRLGCFAYSPEEGTPACDFPDQVDDEVKQHRSEIIMEQQYRIVDEINESKVGKEVECVVEGYDSYTDTYYGRTYMDAPEIDGVINFTCGYELSEGDFVTVEIVGTNEYDLIGEVV